MRLAIGSIPEHHPRDDLGNVTINAGQTSKTLQLRPLPSATRRQLKVKMTACGLSKAATLRVTLQAGQLRILRHPLMAHQWLPISHERAKTVRVGIVGGSAARWRRLGSFDLSY